MPLIKKQKLVSLSLPTNVEVVASNTNEVLMVDDNDELFRISKSNFLDDISSTDLTSVNNAINALQQSNATKIAIPTQVKTSANDGDYFIGIDLTGALYKISKADLLAGLSSGSGGNSGGSTAAQFVTNGLVSHFDSALYSGTGNWNNLVTGESNAALTNVAYDASRNNGVMHFNGNSQAIFATPPSIVTLGEITEEIWVKWTTTGNSVDNIQAILDNNHTGSQGFVLQDLPFLSNQPIDSLYCQTTNRIGNGDWIQLVSTVGTSSAKIYVNGQLNNSANCNGLKPIQPYISMGKWQGGSRFLNGDIGILRIYNRELSSSEVLQNFNASKSRFGF